MPGICYILTYVGGPRDGAEELSPRPYHEIRAVGEHLYANDPDAADFSEWVDDGTRRVRLHYKGSTPQDKRSKSRG